MTDVGPITIRDQRPGDRHRLYELLFAAGFRDQAEDVRRGSSTEYRVLIAADENDQAVGYMDGKLSSSDYIEEIAAHVPPPQAWGSMLAVAESHRRAGVGRALLATFARAARDAGSTWYVAAVAVHGDTAGRTAFFNACGLRPVVPGWDDDYVGGRLDDVIAACER